MIANVTVLFLSFQVVWAGQKEHQMKTKKKRKTRRNKKNQKVIMPPKNPKLIRRGRRKISKQPQPYYQQPQQLCRQLQHVRRMIQSAMFVLKKSGLKTFVY